MRRTDKVYYNDQLLLPQSLSEELKMWRSARDYYKKQGWETSVEEATKMIEEIEREMNANFPGHTNEKEDTPET